MITRASIIALLFVAGAYVQVQETDPALDPALARLDSLSRSDARVVRELVALGPDVLPHVFDRLHSSNRHIAFAAGEVVGQLGDEMTVLPLLEEWAESSVAERYTGAGTALDIIVRRRAPRRQSAPTDSSGCSSTDLLESVLCTGPWAERLDSGNGVPLIRVSMGKITSRNANYLKCGPDSAVVTSAPDDETIEELRQVERASFESRIMVLEAPPPDMSVWRELIGQPPDELALVNVTHPSDRQYPGDYALWARCSGEWCFVTVVEVMIMIGPH